MISRSCDTLNFDNDPDIIYGHPLIAAILCGTDETVDFFLVHGLNVNLVFKIGNLRTPLITAIHVSR